MIQLVSLYNDSKCLKLTPYLVMFSLSSINLKIDTKSTIYKDLLRDGLTVDLISKKFLQNYHTPVTAEFSSWNETFTTFNSEKLSN